MNLNDVIQLVRFAKVILQKRDVVFVSEMRFEQELLATRTAFADKEHLCTCSYYTQKPRLAAGLCDE